MNYKWNRWTVGALGAALAVTVTLGTVATTFAQDQGTPAPGTPAPVVPEGRRGPGGERGGPGGIGRGASLVTIAGVLGISEAELQSALQAGQTVADLATEKSIDLQMVIDALVAEQQTQLAQAVTDGRLTQEQADARLAKLQEELPTQLSTVFTPGAHGPKGGMGGDRAGGLGHGASLTTIATALGVTEGDLTTAFAAGKSVADVATEQGVDLSVVSDALVAERTTALAEAVSAGRLTQAQADEQLAMLATKLSEMLSQAGGLGRGMSGPGSHGPRGGEHGPRGPRGQQPGQQAPANSLAMPESSSAPAELDSDGSV